MNERTEKINTNLCNEIFACRLPSANFQPITYDRLPPKIQAEIGLPTNCGLALEISHKDLTKTYVGQDASLEKIHVQDRNAKNVYLGEGQVYIENMEDELYIPVVGFTFTSKIFRKRGYGTRRLMIMDAVSRVVFEEPLYSSTSPRLSQRSIWEKLIHEESAEVHVFNGVKRFKFI